MYLRYDIPHFNIIDSTFFDSFIISLAPFDYDYMYFYCNLGL